MPKRIDCTKEQILQGRNALLLCGDLLEAEGLKGQPRACESGLLPQGAIHAWAWDDGLVLVSPEVWGILVKEDQEIPF